MTATMTTDWYTKAREEFIFDLWTNNEVEPDAAKKIYYYLCDEGLVDYDVEKDYLYDNYVEDDDKEEAEDDVDD